MAYEETPFVKGQVFRCEAAARQLLTTAHPEAAMLRGREPTAAAAENHDLVVAGIISSSRMAGHLLASWLTLSVPHQRLIVAKCS